jgi:hypothetical protein
MFIRGSGIEHIGYFSNARAACRRWCIGEPGEDDVDNRIPNRTRRGS